MPERDQIKKFKDKGYFKKILKEVRGFRGGSLEKMRKCWERVSAKFVHNYIWCLKSEEV